MFLKRRPCDLKRRPTDLKRTHSVTLFFFIRMLFFRPRLNILIFLPIRLKIFLYYSYDISVLEFIGVSITTFYKCFVSRSVFARFLLFKKERICHNTFLRFSLCLLC